MHNNGTEFPVELTITRIALPGPPTFTGYLRDITDRKRAEAELRASRARLVEVADAERRRIQRNLHDGAQQRLTSVLLDARPAARVTASRRPSCSTPRSRSSRPACRSSASSRAGCTRAVLTERGLAWALEALALRAPIPVDVIAVPRGGCRSRSRRPPTTSSPRRSRTSRSTRTHVPQR